MAVERPLSLAVGEHAFAVLMRTPGADLELCLGLLVAEGVIREARDVRAVDRGCAEDRSGDLVRVHLREGLSFDPERHRRNLLGSSSCGLCGREDLFSLLGEPLAERRSPPIDAALLLRLPELLRAGQEGFARSGGLHAAALFDTKGELLALHEDVGRHNAVDKVVGEALSKGALPLADCVLQVSGRVSFEIVQKASRAGIPVLSAVSAPSSMAIECAEHLGMTLVAFVREGSCNVYAGPERVRELRDDSAV